jgi:hypothetical protein
MSQEILQGTDKLNVAYQKINNNFNDLYGGGGGGGGATNLSGLGDVDLTSPIGNNEALVYDSTANKWENQAIPRDLNALSDVVITSPQTFQVLQYNGTTFANGLVTLNELGDVQITGTPASNAFLQYDGSKWVEGQVNFYLTSNLYNDDNRRRYIVAQMGVM